MEGTCTGKISNVQSTIVETKQTCINTICLHNTCLLFAPFFLCWYFLPGEHGVGVGKREYLYDELGNEAVNKQKHTEQKTSCQSST